MAVMPIVSLSVQIDVTSAVANYLVEEARKNKHQPANVLEEDRLLIYNYCPQFTGKVCGIAAWMCASTLCLTAGCTRSFNCRESAKPSSGASTGGRLNLLMQGGV